MVRTEFRSPQGSILGPLIFNIFINDLFFILLESNICNFADDNTLHVSAIKLDVLMDRLERAAKVAVKWFEYNGMKPNTKKCHLLVCGNKVECMLAKIGNENIIEKDTVKLLGMSIDSTLTFNEHMDLICKTASKKVNALSRQCSILPFHRRKVLMNAFFDSQFSYCPLIWMFHNRTVNNRINKLHFRALRLIYRDYNATFEELLVKDESATIHQRNLQSLATEIFKTIHGLSPPFMKQIFCINENLCSENVSGNTRGRPQFYNPNNPRKVNTGLETLGHLGPKIWKLVPNDTKDATSLPMFKNKIKKHKFLKCPCRLCKMYISNVGYI